MFFLGATLPVGQTLEFWIALPKGKLVMKGEVHHVFEYPEGSGLGVQFTELTHEAEALLNDFITTAPEPVRTTRRSD